MELRQLRYFVAVSEQLSFSRAARSLGMAQPPLSVQIRKLETELGFALFARGSRQVALTPAGRIFADEARALLAKSREAVESARDAAHGRAGRIVLGFGPGAFSERITRRIRKFLRKNRGLRLSVVGETDFSASHPVDALVQEFPETALPSHAVVLERGAVCVAVPPKHRLCDKADVALPDLLGETLLVAPPPHRSAAETVFLSAVGTSGLPLDATPGAADRIHRYWQVSLGLGCGAASSLDRPCLDAILIPVKDCPEAIVTALVVPPDSRAAALPALADAIRAS